jgi:hypothetical protein
MQENRHRIDSRALQSTPESGSAPVTMAPSEERDQGCTSPVYTLGYLLALKVTAASEGDREQVAALAEEVQQMAGNNVEVACVGQGYTGPNTARPLNSSVCSWRWSTTPWQNKASCCRRAASGGAQLRPPSAGSPETTKGSIQPSKNRVCSPSSCSETLRKHSHEGRDRLSEAESQILVDRAAHIWL